MKALKQAAKALLPPVVVTLSRSLRRVPPPPEPAGCRGDYASWDEARRASTGYDSAAILERTRQATLAVKNGTAAYARDGVTFSAVEYAPAVLIGLLRASLRGHGPLHVLDFGGSLGTTYFACRDLVRERLRRWSVVEQPNHVACGRAELADGVLAFEESVPAAAAGGAADMALFSGALQYLPDPWAALDEVLGLSPKVVVVDRIALLPGARSRLTVQRVPAKVYEGSYPHWFLAEEALAARFREGYRLRATLPGFERHLLDGAEVPTRAFVFEEASS